MRVVVAVDAFKGCLSSADAGEAVAAGVRAAAPDAQVRVVPVADGGEGTVDALLSATPGRRVVAPVVDAVGRPVDAAYALLDGGETAVLEAASCVGLGQVDVGPDLPPRAGSAGLGLLVRHAVDRGVRRVVVALGGTACTDGGIGLLVGLGARVRDDAGEPVAAPGVNPLWRFGVLDALPDLGGVDLVVLTDVDSPLHGPAGAAHVFGPQKGATPEQVAHLDGRLTAWGAALAAHGHPVADLPGAGAAGGLGAALLALGARREAGFGYVARAVGLADAVAGADLVLTGEGRVDAQTARGKTPAGVAALGRAAGAVVVALAGAVDLAADDPTGPFDAVLPVHPRPLPLADALDPATTAADLRATAAQVTRLVAAARRPVAPGGAPQ
ncbi:glycerate kinase [Cellulomonas sp. ACRRI]|uniref:glycerate kinase family protein n=1 Tax=Cellulomonas sp. ACRRI TaxID=2918188 RepID=UPI001EF1E38A|nr:glycerate kinase [Cellulomonas sp. ACRRI]MCG7285063.1 glycerate kinase [Cellulomonas sp. ACRRI]